MNFKTFRRSLLSASWLCLTLLAPVSSRAENRADWHYKMRIIVPKNYICRQATSPITIDGKLDEPAWNSAPWTDDFTDIQGRTRPAPRFHTRAKLLWDTNYLYIASELEEPQVWATLTNHDSVIFYDPDFEVFMDPKGETQPYYEFEMNALNTTWDLMLTKPYQDGGEPHNEWEIPGAKTAVLVRGTLNNPADTDQGWTVEIAFPWSVLSQHARHPGPPEEGEQWRLNFSRVEWLITVTNGAYQKVPNTPEDNWVWSPTGVIDMHRPEMWGLIQFTSRPPAESVPAAGIPGKPARDLALEVYYAQLDLWKKHQIWATNFAQLGWSVPELPAGVEMPVLAPTADGYACSVAFHDGTNAHVWRVRQDRLLKLDAPLPVATELFVAQATEKFGDVGRRAAYFITDNMPPADRSSLTCDFLMDNLELALQARKEFPWAQALPERIFFNDVLPYASLDEPRDPWRADFYKLASGIVHDCTNATEAAQAINRDLFNRLKVHYNLARKRNNQSPQESIEQGKATCTGLSIILVDACRAVGVPARAVGVPEWVNKEGNHTWVEIWDGDWHFTGADEFNQAGLDRGWFTNDAALTARSPNPLNQIYATSWRRTGEYFPLAWDLDSRQVPAVNVSARYATLQPDTNAVATVVHLRFREKAGGDRLAVEVEMRSPADEVLATNRTRAGASDMNDMPDFTLPKNVPSVAFRFIREGVAREKIVSCTVCVESPTLDLAWDELAPVPPAILAAEAWLARPAAERGTPPDPTFSREDAARLIALTWGDVGKTRAPSAREELSAKNIVLGEKSLKWMERTFGDAPDGLHNLWITLHGGGEATAGENDANWHGYYGRYEFPPGSINVAPRAPANTWDMWHVKWVDPLLDRLITDFVLQRGVDPNRVYLIGYSAGGDGVYQLAPRMADRFAAATMCAGHPNQVTPDGLRNLPFFLYVGGDDSAYNRNVVVREFSAKMDVLQAADPDGYPHRLTVYPGLPHGMQNREAEAIPRMAPLRRVAWPKRVVWKQSGNALHARFYWLQRDADAVQVDDLYTAHVDGQDIVIETPATGGKMTLRLSDDLLDLDQPIRVLAGGKAIFEGKVPRSLAAITDSLATCEDPALAATALLPVAW